MTRVSCTYDRNNRQQQALSSIRHCLFEDKWRNTSQAIDTFIDYFMLTWVNSNLNGWYEGYADGIPSHNNALEGSNGVIKEECSFRERYPLGRFLVFISQVVNEWSVKRDHINLHIDAKIWFDRPKIELDDWTKANQWLQQKKTIVKLNNSFYIPSKLKTSLDKSEVRAYQTILDSLTWDSFEDLNKSTTSIYKIDVNTEQWEDSSCSCIYFMKNYTCKHIIAVANKLKLNVMPDNAKQIPLGMKRKRGAPSKTKTALFVQ